MKKKTTFFFGSIYKTTIFAVANEKIEFFKSMGSYQSGQMGLTVTQLA